MRIDPEAVYLEISEAVTTWGPKTGHCVKPAAILHWKDGNRWRRMSFLASESNGETLGAILGRVGQWIDAHGLNAALTQTVERKPAA